MSAGRCGTVHIAAAGTKRGGHRVYNVEVQTKHCYYAGNAAVLSHNECPKPGHGHPGKGHRDKSDSPKTRRFQRNKERERARKLEEYRKAREEWNRMSGDARKMRPDKNPDA